MAGPNARVAAPLPLPNHPTAVQALPASGSPLDQDKSTDHQAASYGPHTFPHHAAVAVGGVVVARGGGRTSPRSTAPGTRLGLAGAAAGGTSGTRGRSVVGAVVVGAGVAGTAGPGLGAGWRVVGGGLSWASGETWRRVSWRLWMRLGQWWMMRVAGACRQMLHGHRVQLLRRRRCRRHLP